MSHKNSLLEKKEKIPVLTETKNQNEALEKFSDNPNKIINTTFTPVKKKTINVMSIFTVFLIIFIFILLAIFSIFTIYNSLNTNIIAGVHIKGIDVSGLSPSDAKYQLDNYLKDKFQKK